MPPSVGTVHPPQKTGRAHVAVVSLPRHGHVNPTLGVVRELVRRGHRVSYAITEEFAAQVVEAGAEFVPYRSSLHAVPDTNVSRTEDAYVGVVMPPPVPAAKWLYEAMAVLPQLREAYARDRPDLILYETSYAAPVLAQMWDVPAIRLAATFAAWEGFSQEHPIFADLRDHRKGAAYLADFDAWLARYRVDTSPEELVLWPRQTILLIPRPLQPHAESLPDNCHIVGPCLTDRPFQGTWCPPARADRTLLISLGTTGTDRKDFYRECLTAFAREDWHVVMSTSGPVDIDRLGPLPGNCEVHAAVPQYEVLSCADVFITHGGPGGVSEAIARRVPMVVIPQAWDQFTFAERVERLRIGRYLPRELVTATVLRATVLHLANSSNVAGLLERTRTEMLADGGAHAAADLVECQLTDT